MADTATTDNAVPPPAPQTAAQSTAQITEASPTSTTPGSPSETVTVAPSAEAVSPAPSADIAATTQPATDTAASATTTSAAESVDTPDPSAGPPDKVISPDYYGQDIGSPMQIPLAQAMGNPVYSDYGATTLSNDGGGIPVPNFQKQPPQDMTDAVPDVSTDPADNTLDPNMNPGQNFPDYLYLNPFSGPNGSGMQITPNISNPGQNDWQSHLDNYGLPTDSQSLSDLTGNMYRSVLATPIPNANLPVEPASQLSDTPPPSSTTTDTQPPPLLAYPPADNNASSPWLIDLNPAGPAPTPDGTFPAQDASTQSTTTVPEAPATTTAPEAPATTTAPEAPAITPAADPSANSNSESTDSVTVSNATSGTPSDNAVVPSIADPASTEAALATAYANSGITSGDFGDLGFADLGGGGNPSSPEDEDG